MTTKPQQAVGAVVFDGEGRVLVVRRGKPPLSGAWSLPGGRMEPGETPEAAVEREVLEETGLTVRAQHRVASVVVAEEGFSYEIHDYLCRCESAVGERAGDDAIDARWVALADLPALGVTALAIDVVDRARSTAGALARRAIPTRTEPG